MAILTFMSDFGLTDGYVASVKGRVLSANPNQLIVDISHNIKQYDIAHGSFVLKSVFNDFPVGTVHLTAVNSTGSMGEPYLGVKLNGHYFLGTDNGLLSLLSDDEAELVVILGTTAADHALARKSTFPCRDILAPAAIKLLSGTALNELGETTQHFNRMLLRKPRTTPNLISGHVIYIDAYGNLVTNIRSTEFNNIEHKSFLIKIGREEITKISRTYTVADPGDLFGVFNSQGYLEVGIHSGNAAELLGMEFDSPIIVRLLDLKPEEVAAFTDNYKGRLPLE